MVAVVVIAVAWKPCVGRSIAGCCRLSAKGVGHGVAGVSKETWRRKADRRAVAMVGQLAEVRVAVRNGRLATTGRGLSGSVARRSEGPKEGLE